MEDKKISIIVDREQAELIVRGLESYGFVVGYVQSMEETMDFNIKASGIIDQIPENFY